MEILGGLTKSWGLKTLEPTEGFRTPLRALPIGGAPLMILMASNVFLGAERTWVILTRRRCLAAHDFIEATTFGLKKKLPRRGLRAI